MHKKALASVIAAAAFVGVQAATTMPAQAAGITLTTNNDGTGYAEAQGAITFPTKSSVNIDVTVIDRCPGDGRSAVLIFNGTFGNGEAIPGRVLAQDSSGCVDERYGRFDNVLNYARNIRSVRLQICEIDGSVDPNRCLNQSVKTYDNPKV